MIDKSSGSEEEEVDIIFECPECGGEFKEELDECPHCGVSLAGVDKTDAEDGSADAEGYAWYYRSSDAYSDGNPAFDPGTGYSNISGEDMLFFTSLSYGGSYVFLGGSNPGYTNASSSDYANYGWQENQTFGWSVCHVGYMNGDSNAEMGVGSLHYGDGGL